MVPLVPLVRNMDPGVAMGAARVVRAQSAASVDAWRDIAKRKITIKYI